VNIRKEKKRSEVRQAQKHKRFMFSHTWRIDPKININTKAA
jgi:hypothetical protein